MYTIKVSFLSDQEILAIPSLAAGTEILKTLRNKFQKLVTDMPVTQSEIPLIQVTFLNTKYEKIDEIQFQSIFGLSDYQGLITYISSELKSLQL